MQSRYKIITSNVNLIKNQRKNKAYRGINSLTLYPLLKEHIRQVTSVIAVRLFSSEQ